MRSVLMTAMAVTLLMSVSYAQRPQIADVGNAASPWQGLAPGGVISVFGTSLSDGSTASAAGAPLPTSLAGARLLVNGEAVPLFFASPLQINAQLPVDAPGDGGASFIVEVTRSTGRAVSRARTARYQEHAPGIFTLDQNGTGPGAILRNSDFSLICPPGRTDCTVNRAVRGEIVVIYAVGLGAVDGLIKSGEAAPATYPTRTAPRVSIGDTRAPVLFSGLALGFVGLYQVNVLVPRDAPTGDDVALEMRQGNSRPHRVTIAIAPDSPPVLEQQGGPWAADVRAMAAGRGNPSTLYAGTQSGLLFKSTDGGDHWVATNSGRPLIVSQPYGGASAIKSVVVDPTNPSVVYVAGSVQGENTVVKSVDGGESWEPSGSGITGHYLSINQITISPNNPAVLYVASNTGLFKSMNAGGSWAPAGVTPAYIGSLLIDPLDTSVLYDVSGPRKSTDGGVSWTSIRVGIPADVYVLSMAINPSNPEILYAGTNRAGVYKSTNGGLSWTPAHFGLPASPSQSIVAMAVDHAAPEVVYAGTGTSDDWRRGWGAGVFKSTNGGASWIPVNTGFAESAVSLLQVDYGDSRRVYAGTRNGVLRTTDSGANWTSANAGFPSTSVGTIAIPVARPDRIYAGTESGLFRSLDGGISWEPANFGIPNVGVRTIAFHPREPSTIYAGLSSVEYGIRHGGVFKSTDGGDTWRRVLSYNDSLPALAVDPSDPLCVYAASYRGHHFRTVNGGESWDALPHIANYLTDLIIDPIDSSILYASTESAVYKSIDGGLNWSQSLEEFSSISSLVIDPGNPATLYAGKPRNVPPYVLKTTDGGASWAPADTGMTAGSVTALAVDSADPSTIYASSGTGVVFKTTDGGGSWNQLLRGLPLRPVSSIAIDPVRDAVVYAGIDEAGVFKSVDGGQSWQPTGRD
jgi:uncharacterized protein (TIGR03437 family)